MLIVEGYGLTESSAASFVNLPTDFNRTVGKPIPGVELLFLDVPGEEGTEAKKEILIYGRGIMRGYYNLPEASADVFTQMKMVKNGFEQEMLVNWTVMDFSRSLIGLKTLSKHLVVSTLLRKSSKDLSKPSHHWCHRLLYMETSETTACVAYHGP